MVGYKILHLYVVIQKNILSSKKYILNATYFQNNSRE